MIAAVGAARQPLHVDLVIQRRPIVAPRLQYTIVNGREAHQRLAIAARQRRVRVDTVHGEERLAVRSHHHALDSWMSETKWTTWNEEREAF